MNNIEEKTVRAKLAKQQQQLPQQDQQILAIATKTTTTESSSAATSATVTKSTTTTSTTTTTSSSSPSFLTALIAGGLAGTSVDVALFPIDTIKTRLQSPQGFLAAGAFRGIYNGLGAAAIGSAPGAALFFSTYETCKPILGEYFGSNNSNNNSSNNSKNHEKSFQQHPAFCHMMAASLGEAAACLIRVPTEVIKAKMQTNLHHASSLRNTFIMVWNETHAGGSPFSLVTGGLYRGYGITLFREIPFAMIQFPIYEFVKQYWADHYRNGVTVHPFQAAACGSFSGGIAAAITTPLDVIKTRLMLGADKHGSIYHGVGDVIRRIISQEGYTVFWSGIQPRVMWISIGGFVFFGAYEGFKATLSPILGSSSSGS
jgi:solute carrier family 25 (mitochondrial S-adenosylmethionine transporter), member 26